MKTVLLALGLAAAALPAHSQTPQISEGVRAMAQVGKGGFGPKQSPYMISRQPPIYPYMAAGETGLFDAETDLLTFFQSFPPEVQMRGLWITRAGLAERETQEDRNRLARLVEEARS